MAGVGIATMASVFLMLFIAPGSGTGQTDTFFVEMVHVSGGTFTMGCTPEQGRCGPNESPAHEVTLSDFYIGKYEVTQRL